MSVDFDDMGSVPRAVVLGEAGHRALLQLFDPFDFSLQPIADVDSEPRVFGVENVPLGALFEGVSMGLDEVLKSGDSGIEFPDFGDVVGLPLFDGFEQRLGDALQGIGVEVRAAVQDVSS